MCCVVIRVDVCTYVPPELVRTERNVFTYFSKVLSSAFPMNIDDMSGEGKVGEERRGLERREEERREEEK